jgi:hypothetical protein
MRGVTRLLPAALAVFAIALAGCSSDNASPSHSASPSPHSDVLANSTTPSTVNATPPAQPGSTALVLPSKSTTPEVAYLETLPANGVTIRDEEGTVGTGQRMCEALTTGQPIDAAVQFGLDEQPWTPEQAKMAVRVAAHTLCSANAEKAGN